MRCISCGSSDINTSTCNYCGAVVSVNSISSLRKMSPTAIAAFKPNLTEGGINDLPHDEMASALATQTLVLLERKQWSDALEFSSTCRKKIPHAIFFTQYYIVAALAGNFLKNQSLDTVREHVRVLMVSPGDNSEEKSLTWYLISCVNAAWCDPNKIKHFSVSDWTATDEVISVSQYFTDNKLAKARLLFDESGNPNYNLSDREARIKDKLDEIMDKSDQNINEILSASNLSSIEDLKINLKESISNKRRVDAMVRVLDLYQQRRDHYLDQLVLGMVTEVSFKATMEEALRVGISPFFGGGDSKSAYDKIWKILRKEINIINAGGTFLGLKAPA